MIMIVFIHKKRHITNHSEEYTRKSQFKNASRKDKKNIWLINIYLFVLNI